MYDTKTIQLPEKAEKLFSLLLLFYPKEYKKKFGNEIQILLKDLYQEELATRREVEIWFWISKSMDIIKNAFIQHIDLINQQGMKKYLKSEFNFNRYNLIGTIFLTPALTVFAIDLISRVIQFDLVHYNRPVYNFLSHTPLYWYPVLVTWVIVLPTLAVIINLIPLIKNMQSKKKSIYVKLFNKQNLFSLIILFLGLMFLAIIKLHDFAPCILHGLILKGFSNLGLIINMCRNA